MNRAALTVLCFLLTPLALANTPPSPPVILEPVLENQALNGADVHMVTEQFIDADGDAHRCTDWEIRQNPGVIWSASCVEGPLAVHIHLGDGTFSGSHTGAQELRPNSTFVLRVRHRDDSGDPETEWSEWTSRNFGTVIPTPIPALQIAEVMSEPLPRWTVGGEEVVIPNGAAIDLETVDGDALLHFDAAEVRHADRRLSRVIVRLHITAGDAEWQLPESELSFENGHGQQHVIYLPALMLSPRGETFYWISANGGTHVAAALERTPDFSKIVRGAPVPWSVARGFRADVFASGFELPVSIAAVPNPGAAPDSPFLYVAELYGAVKVITRSGEVSTFASDLLNFDPHAPIPGNGERGLGGITIDPTNGDVIVTGVYRAAEFLQFPSPRVLRLQSDDGGRTAARVLPVIEFPNEQMAPSHQISNVTFGPDDKLYVHVGSSFSWIAQDLNSTDGKILRVNRDGSAPTDNPFYNADDGISATDYIFALGFRNPFGGAWRMADQSLYEVENGPSTDRFATVLAGRNYLWDGTDASMRNYAIYNWTSPVAPVQIAFTEPERFGGSGFPSSRMRSAFVTESGATWASGPQLYGKEIGEFVFAEDGSLQSGPTPLAKYDGSGKATAAGLVAGADGLYFTDLYRDYGQATPFDAGANVIRIRWVGAADFDARFLGTSTVALTDRSDVPDAHSISWDFGDGATSGDRNPVHRYEQPGTYLVRQTITGPRGTVTEPRRIFAGSDAPGIHAEYFESDQQVSPAVVRDERSLQFDWTDAAPTPLVSNDAFTARFTARLTPRFSEHYQFTVQSKDRVRLSLDNKPLIDAWQPSTTGEATASISLIAGQTYALTVDYAADSTAPSLRVLWESASQPANVVPQTVRIPRRRAVTPP